MSPSNGRNKHLIVPTGVSVVECQSHQYTMRFLNDKNRTEPTRDSAVHESSISVSGAFNRLLTYDCFKPLNIRAQQRKWRRENET